MDFELTLEPELEATPAPVEEPKPPVETPPLSQRELAIVNEFAAKIDVENNSQILQYGAGTQKKMADFSDAALQNVRTQDLGEVGALIADVVGELSGFDAEEERGFLGFFKKQADKLETMKNRFAKAETNVAKIGDALEQHQIPEAFSHCEKIIAGRFHAMVLALRMQIPVYPLIFREKGRNLLKDLEFPHDYCGMDDIDTASLRAFLLGTQIPYQLDKEIMLRAREHTKRLLEHIAEN